jgi:uncharacterized RDD family membrane protein YckC
MESGANVEHEEDHPPVARLLNAGAKGAGRVAQATRVDRALDKAVEEALMRALTSPPVTRAIERAVASHAVTVELNSEELAEMIKRVLESQAAEQAWAEVLASDEVQMLVERIAGAPELRAAIAAQSAGLITDIGVRLTKLTEAFDDVLERIVRRGSAESETNQAGLATRLVAAGIDIGLLALVYSLASGAISSVISFTFGGELSLPAGIVLGTLGVLVAGAIFITFWALAGQTPGMRFLSIRIVKGDSHHITLGVAVRRLLGALVSIAALGLGYLAILRDPQRRAWHDRMVGTEVIYDPIQRAAPHAGVPAPTGASRAQR